jgi:hypothetical protein
MVIAAKALIGVCCLLLGVILSNSTHLLRIEEVPFRRAVLFIWFVTRVGLFLAVFWALHVEPASDLPAYYYPQAELANRGLLVYRDFPSSYAPLFPYALGAALRLIWHSPKMIIVLAIAAEGLSLPFWMGACARVLPGEHARRAALLYVASAAPLVNVALEGQNQVWVSLCLAVAVWLYGRGREVGAAVALSLSVVLVKFLALLSVPAFFFRNSRRTAIASTFAVTPLLVYGFLLVKGADILSPLRGESGDQTAGNLPFLATGLLMAFGINVPLRVLDGITLALLAGLSVWLSQREPQPRAWGTMCGVVLLLATVLLFSKKAYPSYLVMAFYPFCAIAASDSWRWWNGVIFGCFGVVAMLEPTLWFRWHGSRQLFTILQRTEDRSLSTLAMFLIVELALMGFYLSFWRRAWQRLINCSTIPHQAAHQYA